MDDEGAGRDSTLEQLARQRAEVARIDGEIVALLAARLRIGKAIGDLKRAGDLPMLDPAREEEVIRNVSRLARDAKLDPEPVRAIFRQVIELSRRTQA
jgi:chorismate mutase